MFDVGWQELLVVLAVALLIFGPERMVDLARTAGKSLREFRKITTELSSGLTDVLKEDAPRRTAPETPTTDAAPAPAPAPPPVFTAPLTIPPPDPVPPDEYEPTMPNFPVESEPVAGEPPIGEPNAPAEA
jgi:Tat protein translocase TatB subunit